MPLYPPAGGVNVSISGNTDGTPALVSSGTLTMAGGDNITLSQAGNAITIVGAAGGTAAGSFSGGISNIGNTSGTSGVVQARLVLAGGNNITLSQSVNGQSATLTISAANESQTVPPIGTAVKGVSSVGSTGTITRFAPEDHQHAGVFSAGVSNVGNTSGDTLVGPVRLVLAGGNNVTLSAGTAAGNLMTVTISAANETQTVPPIATAVKGVSSVGSTGTVTRFAPEDHQHAGVFSAGVSDVGNTSGDTVVFPGRLVLAGGNNVTLSVGTAAGNLMTVTISAANETQTAPPIGTAVKGVSSVGSTGTITRFAPEDHQHAGVFSAGVSDVGNTSGDTLVGPLRLVLAGGNNITLSGSTAAGNLMTVTISGADAGATAPPIGTAVKGVSSVGSTGTITRFAPEDHQHAGVFSAGVSNVGNTSGDTVVFPGQLVLAGGNNVTLSVGTAAGNLMTVTVSAGAAGGGATKSFYEVNAAPLGNVHSFTRGPQQPIFTPFALDWDGLSAKTIRLFLSRVAGTTLEATLGVGFYTMSNATKLNLVSSTTHAYSVTVAANWNSVRQYDVTGLSALTLSKGQWWIGVHLSATATNRGNMIIQGIGGEITPAGIVYPGDNSVGASSASDNFVPFHGMLSFSTASLPSSVGLSDMLGGGGSTEVGRLYAAIRQI